MDPLGVLGGGLGLAAIRLEAETLASQNYQCSLQKVGLVNIIKSLGFLGIQAAEVVPIRDRRGGSKSVILKAIAVKAAYSRYIRDLGLAAVPQSVWRMLAMLGHGYAGGPLFLPA